ncbi:cleavage and polyadenylation specificity factor subunit 2-like [Halichondria panicea]|uniref:cleavage and polyadenylation specificity factor subunit 2-like n=1 Tax=Halichondria panicea TaxID=6063 RepID=UPI00312BB01B
MIERESMTSIINFTALSGAHNESPPCYLLQVDEFCFLLDCGWDSNVNTELFEALKKHVSQIDAVLLSFPDVTHLGALPYLVGKLELKCPVYATIPVFKMGQMFMYDLYQSRRNGEEFDLFTLDDVDAAFDQVVQVKYSQTIQLKGKGHGLTITPYAAGHMVGGAMWKIVKDGEEEIIYAVDYNHKKERHLDGAVLESLSRPHLLITDTYNALNVQARRKERDQALLTNILKTLRSDGNVLIAVDTAGRVLELSQLLDQMWRNQESGLCAYSIALLNNVGYNVVEFAKSQVEWMSDKIMRMFEDHRNNPFQFKHITICHNMADLMKVPEPKAVLASMSDLECGFSRQLFIQWASVQRNSIILTSKPPQGTLARQLINDLNVKSIDLTVRQRVSLEGEELEAYRLQERKKAQLEAEKDSELTEDSDEEMEVELSASFGPPKAPKHDLMLEEGKAKSIFFKQAKSFPMFPCREERPRWDEYGEPIRQEDYKLKDVSVPVGPVSNNAMDVSNTIKRTDSSIPTKCISQKQTVAIRCSLSHIDFEGKSDGESIKRILSIVKPRQLVLVHGSSDCTNTLMEFARKTLNITDDNVMAPYIGETVNATTESHIYQVKLKDSLMSSVNFSHAKDAELAWLDGEIHFTQTTSSCPEEGGDNKEGPVLGPISSGPITTDKGHSSVFINPPRLSDFKQVLTKAGISAEFSGGVLVCSGVVAIRRGESGGISLEGAVCPDYYTIRKLLYEQFAII